MKRDIMGYLKAETFAANMFQKMFANGSLLDTEKGMIYRKKILEPGASKDAIDILRDYLGEEPVEKYFLIDKFFSSQLKIMAQSYLIDERLK